MFHVDLVSETDQISEHSESFTCTAEATDDPENGLKTDPSFSSITSHAYCSTGYSKPKVSFLPPIHSVSQQI